MSSPVDPDTGRVEEIDLDTREWPRPAEHGFDGQVVLHDTYRDAGEIDVDVPEWTSIRDGSLYNRARATWLQEENDGQRVILDRSYRPEWFGDDDPDEVAAVLTSSRWMAGTGRGDDYSAWFKYDLTLRPLDDDGEIRHGATPVRSLSLKIHPQYQDLVYKDGSYLDPPYGEGSLVHIKSTYVDSVDEARQRAAAVVDDLLGYEWDTSDEHPDSVRWWKAEVYDRITEERKDDVVSTIRQSQELIPHHGGGARNESEASSGDWSEIRLETDDWHLLGFENLDVEVYLKVYYMDSPERLEYPLDQPKVEAGLLGSDDLKFAEERYEEILDHLREILLAHLEWAGCSPADLVADDLHDGAAEPRHEWSLPQGRRSWLRDHYESFVPDIYREAQRERTMLSYDILETLRRRRSPATYEDLIEATGAAYRTVRKTVQRLEEIGPDDEPGILERDRGAVTTVWWAEAMQERASDVLDEVHPADDSRDRVDRSADRLGSLLEERGLQEESADELVDAVESDHHYTRADLERATRDADVDRLQEIADDLGLDRDLELDPDDDRDHMDRIDEIGDDQEERSDDDELREAWRRLDRLGYSIDDLADMAGAGYLEETDARINIAPYDWLEDPGG